MGIKYSNITPRSFIGALLIGVALIGCKKPEHFIGKEYKEASPNLSVAYFESDLDEVDFAKDSIAFIGEFSEKVSWYINLKGLSSGAIRTLEGLSEVIDPSVTKWGGDHEPSNLRFFQKGEKVVAELSFMNSSVVERDTFTIKTTKKFQGTELFLGFENAFSYYSWGNNYLFFNETAPLTNSANPMVFKMETSRFVQGKQALSISGADNDNTYFIGGARTFIPDGLRRFFVFESNNPDSVYFNAYIYGDPRYPNTRMAIGISEDDNQNGTFEPTTEDVWEYAVKINWTGWRLLSMKYSDFSTSVSRENGGSGNKKRELDRVKQITFNVLGDPAGSAAGYLIDYPIITYGGSFDPSK